MKDTSYTLTVTVNTYSNWAPGNYLNFFVIQTVKNKKLMTTFGKVHSLNSQQIFNQTEWKTC